MEPKPPGRPELVFGLTQRPQPEVTQGYDWDYALTPSEDNPFPLAPKDLVDQKKMTQEIYEGENEKLKNFALEKMLEELKTLSRDPSFSETSPKVIEVMGVGLMRDLWWIQYFGDRLKIIIRDKFNVPLEKAEEFITDYKLKNIETQQSSIEDAWASGEINDDETIAYYGGQFMQNQDKATKDRMLKHLGTFLGLPSSPPRRIYLLHARGEDNPKRTVLERNSIPYTDKELQKPLEEGLGRKVKMEVMGTHKYHHHNYTLFRIMAEENTSSKAGE